MRLSGTIPGCNGVEEVSRPALPPRAHPNVYLRRYQVHEKQLQIPAEKTDHFEGQEGSYALTFYPLLQTGEPEPDYKIEFTAHTRELAWHAAFKAGFRMAEIEEDHKEAPDRWKERW